MRILELLDDLYIVQLDVEVLVDALQRATDLDVILKLDSYLVVDERLEEAVGLGLLVSSCSPSRFRDRSACMGGIGIGRYLPRGRNRRIICRGCKSSLSQFLLAWSFGPPISFSGERRGLRTEPRYEMKP